MAAPVFPGAHVARADLVARLRQCDTAFANGVTPPETERVYGNYQTVVYHDRFSKDLEKYPQPTLGDISSVCGRQIIQNQRQQAKWERRAGWIFGGIIAGCFAAVGGFVSAATASSPLITGLCIGCGVLGVAMMIGGMVGFMGLPEHYDSKIRHSKDFQEKIQHWGDELAAAAPPAPPMMTAGMSPEEKRQMAEQLLHEADTAEQAPVRKVERKEDTVHLGGVSVPVKRG